MRKQQDDISKLQARRQALKREIKFRAWNKIQKRMFNPFNMDEMVKGHLDYDEKEMRESAGFPVGTVFLQFTGCKDKNEKEIYEGDILRFSMNWQSKPICKDVVAWSEGRAMWTIQRRGYVLNCLYNVEVIGNIYKNPELLKSSHKDGSTS